MHMCSYIHEAGDKPYHFPHLTRSVETALCKQVCNIQEEWIQDFPLHQRLGGHVRAMTAVETQKQTWLKKINKFSWLCQINFMRSYIENRQEQVRAILPVTDAEIS